MNVIFRGILRQRDLDEELSARVDYDILEARVESSTGSAPDPNDKRKSRAKEYISKKFGKVTQAAKQFITIDGTGYVTLLFCMQTY